MVAFSQLFSEDPSEVESIAKINYRTEGIKMKASVNDGEGTIRQGQGGMGTKAGSFWRLRGSSMRRSSSYRLQG